MSEKQSVEKDVSICDKRLSTEDPLSPVSDSRRSSESSESERERCKPEDGEKDLIHQISHTSSAREIGHVPASLHKIQTNRSIATTVTIHDPAFEVDFQPDDKANPRNWSLWYRGFILAAMSYGTTCVVLYSSSYTSSIPGIQAYFGVSDEVGILPLTTYLLGLALGSLILAPLSEMYGRRPIYLVALIIFAVFVIPCAVAENMETILITRFFGALCASAMISNAPGTINDIVDDEYRALAYSIWSIGPINGPVIGPVVGGFVFQYLGWRWDNWVVAIAAGVAWAWVSLVKETYAPVILRKQAAKLQKETEDNRWWSRYDEHLEFLPLLKINMSRPFVMMVTEPICIFWDIYIALVYGILYLCFVAYPIVFTDLRGWSPGISGLSFCGIGVGTMIVICSEPLIRKMIRMHKPDPNSESGDPPPEAMVSIVCIAAVLIPAGEIWFAWTGTPNVHWIVPILAGVPFGMGNCAVFIYATNYLVYSYNIYAASALAGNALLRSIMGATMPLAGDAMYKSLGPHWAGTLLALLEAACIPIPFVFYRYGWKIRSKSPLIRKMREDKEKQVNRRRKAKEKAIRRAAAEADSTMIATGAALDEEIDSERVVEPDLEMGRPGKSV